MKWFVPSWNGDLRLEPHSSDPKKTELSIVKPTEAEKKVLAALTVAFNSRKWLDEETALLTLPALWKRKKVVIQAPIEDVGPLVTAIMRPGPGTLTAIKFIDGHVETCEKHVAGEAPAEAYRTPAALGFDAPEKSGAFEKQTDKQIEPSDESKALAKKPDATAAATVARPTPSCPDCYIDAMPEATEVLLAFLSEEQHKTWAKERYVIVQGGLSGHRYLIAHRHSPIAKQNTRICFDLDDDHILHFHDWTVPPEEEVLASMLILEHKEPWLRNEATCLGGNFECRFKNPFGDFFDGVADSTFTRKIGMLLGAATGMQLSEQGEVNTSLPITIQSNGLAVFVCATQDVG